jgi:hypothetical protein
VARRARAFLAEYRDFLTGFLTRFLVVWVLLAAVAELEVASAAADATGEGPNTPTLKASVRRRTLKRRYRCTSPPGRKRHPGMFGYYLSWE